jgi:hypothetical protein
MAQLDKTQKTEVEPIRDPHEVDVIRVECFSAVSLDGNVKNSFNMKNESVVYHKLHQIVTVVGSKQTVIIPFSNIMFMHV